MCYDEISMHIAHFFLPHNANNHRAKALHIDSLLIYILLFTLFNFSIRLIHRQYPDVLGYATNIHMQQLLEETNKQRVAHGLSQLTYSSELSQAAVKKATDMFASGYWAHTGPAGKTPWDFIMASGYQYTLAGENLAKNFSTSQGVVNAWMESASHRDNILKSGYKDVGFAVVNGVLNGEETTLVVQMFGSSQPISLLPQGETVQIPSGNRGFLEEPFRMASQVFAAVDKRPLLNIPSITRDAAYLFIGVLIGVLILDAWVISRKRIIRVSGHNLAHIAFLLAMVIALAAVRRGTLL